MISSLTQHQLRDHAPQWEARLKTVYHIRQKVLAEAIPFYGGGDPSVLSHNYVAFFTGLFYPWTSTGRPR